MPETPLLDGLRNLWRLDEPSGSRADAVGPATLTESAEAVPSAAGKFGDCADWSSLLSSQTANLASAYNAAYDLASPRWTVGGWFYGLSTAAIRNLFAQRAEGGTAKLYVRNDFGSGKIVAQDGTNATITTANQYALNQWNLVLVSRDGTDGAVWLNGTKATGTFGAIPLGQVQTRLGAIASTGPVGRMDQWAVWDYPVSDADAEFLWGGGAGVAYPFAGAPEYARPTPDPVTYPDPVVLYEEVALPAGGGTHVSDRQGTVVASLAGNRLSWTHTKAASQSKAFFYFHLVIDGVYAGGQWGPAPSGGYADASHSGSDATAHTWALTINTSALRNGPHTLEVGIGDAENRSQVVLSIPLTASGNSARWSGAADLFLTAGQTGAGVQAGTTTADDVWHTRPAPEGVPAVAPPSYGAGASNPRPGSVAGSGQYRGVTAGDVTEYALPGGLGNHVVAVRASASADLPHFGRSGAVRTAYAAADSLVPFSTVNAGFDLRLYGPAALAAIRAAGLLPEQGLFRPPDGCASAAQWWAAGAGWRADLAAQAADWGDTPWVMRGDDLLRGDQAVVRDFLTAPWFAAGVAQWVAFLRTVAGGPCYVVVRDEVEATYGLDPTDTGNQFIATLTAAAFPALVAALRAAGVPVSWLGFGAVAHSHPRGNSLWHTAAYSDAAHAVADYSRNIYAGRNRLPGGRALTADATHHRWTDRPLVQLVPAAAYTDFGSTIGGVPTVVHRANHLKPRDLPADCWERLSRGATALRAYTFEPYNRLPFEPPEAPAAADLPRGPRFDDLDPLSRATGDALLVAARTVRDYTPLLLGAERDAPAYGPHLKAFRRESARGVLLALLNLSEGLERVPANLDVSPYTAAEVFDGLSRAAVNLWEVPGRLLTAGQVAVLTGPEPQAKPRRFCWVRSRRQSRGGSAA